MNRPGACWLEGMTEDGITVSIDLDPYMSSIAKIKIDGVTAKVVGRVKRYRDGGTTIIPTDKGEIFVPAPRYEKVPTLDGKEIGPF